MLLEKSPSEADLRAYQSISLLTSFAPEIVEDPLFPLVGKTRFASLGNNAAIHASLAQCYHICNVVLWTCKKTSLKRLLLTLLNRSQMAHKESDPRFFILFISFCKSLCFARGLFQSRFWTPNFIFKFTLAINTFSVSPPSYIFVVLRTQYFYGHPPTTILVVFSACGAIRTGSKLPVLTAYFPVLA